MSRAASRSTPATIAAGDSESGALQRAGDLRAIVLPAGFEGTYVSFLASDAPEGDYVPVHDGAGNEVLVAVEASTFVGIPADVRGGLSGISWLKIRAGSSVAPVVQAANRALRVILGGA